MHKKKNSKIVKNTTIKLLKNKNLNFFFDNFDRKYLALYLQFYLDQKIYFKICQNEIYKFIKIKKRVNIFSLNFVDFLYFLKFLKNVGYFYFTFFFKKNQLSKNKYDILINNFFGFDNNKLEND